MYDQIAHYYDLTHDQLTDDIPFILQMAARAGGPMLELGCGTGRLLAPLAQAGYTVTGVDNSPAMLARAAKRLAVLPAAAQQRVTLLQADMTEVVLDDGLPFALTLLPYNTALHLPLPQLNRVLRRIKPFVRGTLLIDVANPFVMAATPNDRMLTLENVLVDPETAVTITQFASNWLDDEAQILHITWLYDSSPTAGGPVHRVVAQADYHYLYPHQWQMTLADAGLRLTQMLGGYDGRPFNEESDRLILQVAI